jgi:hypothetical protein
MSQPSDDQYSWLPWVTPALSGLVIIWAVVRGYFALVSRKELKETLEKMAEAQAVRDAAAEALNATRHEENLQNFREIFGRIGGVEVSVGEINGELRARFGAGS